MSVEQTAPLRSRLVSVEIVVAVARNGVIGRDGTLPWHLPDDLKHFKAVTMGETIIMGRKTFESIGKALPGRTSVVVSGTMDSAPVGVTVVGALDEAIGLASGRAIVIGGAQLYASALERASVLHWTQIEADVEGDTFFPSVSWDQWTLQDEILHPADERHALAFRFQRFVRRD